MMNAVKGIPYGVARFEEVRNENFYYVDKTMYLPLLEDTGKYLFLIRPRRFGKSVFVSMMQAYYDIAQADKFDRLFDGLWIQQHPTLLKNSFQVIYFDFSQISGRDEQELEGSFNRYCGQCGVLRCGLRTDGKIGAGRTWQADLHQHSGAYERLSSLPDNR